MDIDDYAAGLVEELAADARVLDCEPELRHALTTIREGTSADRYIDLYPLRRLEGDSEEALRSVVDIIFAETREGIVAAVD